MATQLLSGLQPQWITLSDDDDATEYQVRALSGMHYAQVMAESRFENGMMIISEKSLPLIIQHGLIGWRGVTDANGNAVEFSPALVRQLPGSELYLLASRIFNLSVLSDAEKKT